MDWLEQLAGELAINVAERLLTLNKSRALTNHKVFILTNNSAFEGSYYKGHLSSKELSNIVFHLYKAQQTGGFILHVLHISGKRMKGTGVNGLSRGDHTEGMMVGKDPMSFLPFHQGADIDHRKGWESGSGAGGGPATVDRALSKARTGVGSRW
jgi:hypothetical protein